MAISRIRWNIPPEILPLSCTEWSGRYSPCSVKWSIILPKFVEFKFWNRENSIKMIQNARKLHHFSGKLAFWNSADNFTEQSFYRTGTVLGCTRLVSCSPRSEVVSCEKQPVMGRRCLIFHLLTEWHCGKRRFSLLGFEDTKPLARSNLRSVVGRFFSAAAQKRMITFLFF